MSIEKVEMPKNVLNVMFNMQNDLQNKIGAKRGTICPNSWNNDITDKHRTMAKESGYYMMSTVTELFEMFEQFKKDKYEFTELTKFELIDAWHFVMNQLLYLNIIPEKTLDDYYDEAFINLQQVTFVNHDLHHLVGELIEAMGSLYQYGTTYKMWKTYSEEETIKKHDSRIPYADSVLVKFMQICVAMNMSKQDIWNYYYAKNKENFGRQEAGGRYEK